MTSQPTQPDGPPEPENQVQKELWEALLNCGFTPSEIAPPDEEITNDDTGELAFGDKARKIISILEPEELDSVIETLQDGRSNDNPMSPMLSSKLKGNAGLVMMLLVSLWSKASEQRGTE